MDPGRLRGIHSTNRWKETGCYLKNGERGKLDWGDIFHLTNKKTVNCIVHKDYLTCCHEMRLESKNV